jgi:hypothetical protein
MANPSTAHAHTHTWGSGEIGAQQRDLVSAAEDIMEITDDMLIELSPEDERPAPPLPPRA